MHKQGLHACLLSELIAIVISNSNNSILILTAYNFTNYWDVYEMREMIGNKSMHMANNISRIFYIELKLYPWSSNLIEHLKSYHNVIKHFKMLQ